MPLTTIPVRTPSASYDVHLAPDLLPEVGQRLDTILQGTLASGNRRAFLLTSPEILRLHGAKLLSGFGSEIPILEVPAGEQHKRLSTVERLLEELATLGADRNSVLLAFGGGVLGDITGFVAASYMRGIPYVQIPTTALAQIDSSVGGKTGVNLAAGKNLVGAFHHPLAVYADVSTLGTLPPAELRAGLQEAVKAGIIRDRALFDFMEANHAAILNAEGTLPEAHLSALTRVLADSIRVKADVVALDERESGLRMILNLGHTLGHALEAATGYNTLLHGEAVAWGMIAALHIAKSRGTVTPEEAARMDRTIRLYGPLRRFQASPQTLVDLSAKDKKHRGKTRNFVLPQGIGDAKVVTDIPLPLVFEAAEAIVIQAASQPAV